MSNIIPYKVLVKILLENGWELDHTTGSHEIYIFIRAIKPDMIEYCVSTEKKIKKSEFIEKPQKLKLM